MRPATALLSDLDQRDRVGLIELAPVLRRTAELDARSLVRLRMATGKVAALVRLPFDVLVARAVAIEPDHRRSRDATVGVADVLAWIDDVRRVEPPLSRDLEWRGSVPPSAGWRRVDTVPEAVVRGLVRSGAAALKEAATREGVPGAPPRPEVAAALLNSVVLTVTDDNVTGNLIGEETQITLRSLSALTRMGFLPPGSHIAVDVAGRWTRIAAAHGSVFAERPGLGLGPVGLFSPTSSANNLSS
jgi:hypothetical protein